MSESSLIDMFSGTEFNLENPQAKDVKLIDIAWHLSNICRFFGGTEEFYSVAQHSVLCSMQASAGAALACLVHDAPEAYTNDHSSPMKRHIPELTYLEGEITKAINERFGFAFSEEIIKEVKSIDRRMLATERIQLTRYHDNEWESLKGVQLLDIDIRPWEPYEARRRFLERFQAITSTDLIKDVQAAFKELYKG